MSLATSKNCIFYLQYQRFQAFKSQDVEKGGLDVAFEIQGKIVRANRFVLTGVSEPLDIMLSERWTKKDEAIKIENYSYENFYEFISFLYTGRCTLTPENIFHMVDIAEFYSIPCFKAFCDEYLSAVQKSVEELEEMFEFAVKYSLTEFLHSIKSFIEHQRDDFYKSPTFLSLKKPMIEFISTIDRRPDYDVKHKYIGQYLYFGHGKKESVFFEAVYKWAEHQVLQQKDATDEKFNLEEAVKAEFFAVFPEPEFCKMSYTFLMNFVVEKGFLLSADDFSKFIEFLRLTYRFDLMDESEETLLKAVYRLAEKQALKKQMLSPDDESFSLADSIKADLVEVIPQIKFCEMYKQFLKDFVVANGIITEEEASHVFCTRVSVVNHGKVISGVFDDAFGLRVAIQKLKSYFVKRRSTTKVTFPKLKFRDQKPPCKVQKMKGVEWYLCFESDGMLTFKHHSAIVLSDYLIAEMKGDPDFQLVPDEKTYVKAAYNNVQAVV